jgi:hypothetical protein
MELDDLRRQWRQPEPASEPVTLSTTALVALAAQQHGGLVEKMRRNARFELALNVVLALLVAAALPRLSQLTQRILAGALLLMAAGLCYYYYRLLAMLRLLSETTGSVRGHLERLCAGLRQLLHFYYKLTLATTPATLLLMYGYQVGGQLARPKPHGWQTLGIFAVVMLVFGAIMQVGLVKATRWYLNRLYGQHLDRLEGQLRELTDGPEA